jgi:hypothetical protein
LPCSTAASTCRMILAASSKSPPVAMKLILPPQQAGPGHGRSTLNRSRRERLLFRGVGAASMSPPRVQRLHQVGELIGMHLPLTIPETTRRETTEAPDQRRARQVVKMS